MLATEITTHVDDALNRLLQQYRGLPNLEALITAFVEQYQLLESEALFPLDEDRQFFNGTTYPAFGVQLDGIGKLVGVGRNGLQDDEYLIFIIGTIAENFSDTTRATMITILKNFFMPTALQCLDMYPAEFNVEISGNQLDPALNKFVFPIIQNSLGAGIGLGFISVFDETEGFVIGDDEGDSNNGLGFSDDDGAGNPSGPGGLFASDIYVNSAA